MPEHRSLRFATSLGSPEPLLRCPRLGTSTRDELESEGPLRKESVTHRNSAGDSLWVFQITRVFCANLTQWEWRDGESSVYPPWQEAGRWCICALS
jgi:hypothetical protein